MRILLVVSLYRPEVSSAAELMKELAEELAARGHEVTVLTSAPLHRLDERDSNRVWPVFEREGKVAVVRARTLPLHQVGYIRRGLGILFGPLQMWKTLRRHVADEFDAAFIYSPPVTLGAIGCLLKRRGTRVLFNVQDIFPQNAIDLGILRNPLAIAFFRWIERSSYRCADVVTAHSRSNLELLQKANPDDRHKFRILHNWIDTSQFTAAPAIDYRKQFGLDGKVVALFAGVLGPSQDVTMLVEAARRLRDLSDLVILIVGDGTEKRRAEELASEYGLANVMFRPFISQEDYPDLLASVDIGLVCLSTAVKTPVVPGKILGYMVASLPVAAFVNKESDVHELVRAAGCGHACVSSDLGEIERILRSLHGDRQRRRLMGENGRQYAVENFSKDRITSEVEAMLADLPAKVPPALATDEIA